MDVNCYNRVKSICIVIIIITEMLQFTKYFCSRKDSIVQQGTLLFAYKERAREQYLHNKEQRSPRSLTTSYKYIER